MKIIQDEQSLFERACATAQTTPDCVKRKCRQRWHVDRRHLVFLLLQSSGMTHNQIAQLTDHDRTTVMHGLHRMNDLAEVYPAYAQTVKSALTTFNPASE